MSGNTQPPKGKRQELAENARKHSEQTGEPMSSHKAYTLKMRGGKSTYVKRDGTVGTAGKGALVGDDCAFTLSLAQDQTIFAYDEKEKDYIARKFTPIEQERLQGFPDDWTKVPFCGKSAEECPDAKRYKAVGNSMAVPVMRWLGERLLMVEALMGDEAL